MMKIIEVVESTSDPAEVENRWFEIAAMLSEENKELGGKVSPWLVDGVGPHASNGLVRENASGHCLVDA